jgi:hypothetical protein
MLGTESMLKRVARAEQHPRCENCDITTILRTFVLDTQSGREVGVYQCPNCAKLHWKE